MPARATPRRVHRAMAGRNSGPHRPVHRASASTTPTCLWITPRATTPVTSRPPEMARAVSTTGKRATVFVAVVRRRRAPSYRRSDNRDPRAGAGTGSRPHCSAPRGGRWHPPAGSRFPRLRSRHRSGWHRRAIGARRPESGSRCSRTGSQPRQGYDPAVTTPWPPAPRDPDLATTHALRLLRIPDEHRAYLALEDSAHHPGRRRRRRARG